MNRAEFYRSLRLSVSQVPDILTTILDDSLPNSIKLFDLALDPPASWECQRLALYHGLHDPAQQDVPLPDC